MIHFERTILARILFVGSDFVNALIHSTHTVHILCMQIASASNPPRKEPEAIQLDLSLVSFF
jgi:hypothetical protein